MSGFDTDQFYKQRIVQEPEQVPLPEPYPLAICTPMYNSEQFLTTYLDSVRSLDYPKEQVSIYWTVQGDDNTEQKLQLFKDLYGSDYKKIKIKRQKMIKGGHQPHVKNVVRNRNLMIKWSRPDKVLFIDHDNFPPPFTLGRLEQCHQLGADIAGGVYPFFQEDNTDKTLGRVGFCAFFTHGDKYYHASLDRPGTIGEFNGDVMGRRLWVEATCMGCTLIRREVLDDVRFTVPFDSEWTDDTRFCYDASERGYMCMSDFGLFVRHWGFDLDLVGKSGRRVVFKLDLQPSVVARRSKMNVDGVYPS